MKTKKIIALLIFAVMFFACTSCGENNSDELLTTENNSALVTEVNTTSYSQNIIEHNPIISTQEVSSLSAENYTEHTDNTGFSGCTVGGTLKIVSVGSYSGIVAVTVRNAGEKDIEYMLISAKTEEGDVYFNVSVLPVGTTAIITENNSTAYKENMKFTLWQAQNEIYFSSSLSLCEKTFEISIVNDSISIKNITDNDIDGNIYIVYKDVENGVFTGKEAYRISFNSLKAGQTKQTSAEHFSFGKSRIVYVSYGK